MQPETVWLFVGGAIALVFWCKEMHERKKDK